MSESSTPLDSVFDTQRTLITRTIETQEEISRQSLDLTRQAVRPLADAAPAEDAESQVEEAFDRIEETRSDVFREVQNAAEETVDASEDAAAWSFEMLEDARDTVESGTEEVVEETREVAGEVEETADGTEDVAETATDDVEAAAEEFRDGLENGVDATTDEFEEFYGTLESELDEFDENAVENLLDEGVESLSDLTTADVSSVAEAVDTTEDEARDLVDVAVDREDENIADLEGIGRTYSDRLADSGIRTQSDLSRTSAEAVADVAGVSEDRAAEWVQRAQEQA